MHPLVLMISQKPSYLEIEDKLIPESGIGGDIVDFFAKSTDKILDFLGVNHDPTLAMVLYSTLVLAIAVSIGLITRYLVVSIVELFFHNDQSILMGAIRKKKLVSQVTSLIPPIVYIILLHLTYIENSKLINFLLHVTFVYVVYVMVRTINKFVDILWLYFDTNRNKRRLPLKSLAQMIQVGVWVLGVIIALAIISNKSPGALLAGFGAFTAIIMLIFKNNILSVVAGMQLSEEDALHVGDWIKVHGTNADGYVIESNLISVKVKNFDNTTTYLPPYSLISGSFTNYRSMFESGARQIHRTYLIDVNSIRLLDSDSLEKYKSIPFMDEWISKKQQQEKEGKEMDAGNPDKLANGSLETNLGLFRAYIKMYLDNSKYIDHNALCMVGTDQQLEGGVPLLLFCYTNTTVWADYMSIQSKVFEHLAVMLTFFDLVTFENPSGRDIIGAGYVVGNVGDNLFGAPEPILRQTSGDNAGNKTDNNAGNPGETSESTKTAKT